MRSLPAWLLVLALVPAARADAPPPPRPSVQVSHVEGPRTLRAVHAGVRRAALTDCQHTFIGGDVIFDVSIDAAGALTVLRTRAGEEVRSYARCVARALARIPFGPAAGVTRARVRVRFPPLGLGAPTPTGFP